MPVICQTLGTWQNDEFINTTATLFVAYNKSIFIKYIHLHQLYVYVCMYVSLSNPYLHGHKSDSRLPQNVYIHVTINSSNF